MGREAWIGLSELDDGAHGAKHTLADAKARLIAEALRSGTPLHLALIEILGDCPPNLVPQDEQVKRRQEMTVGIGAEEWYASLQALRRRKSLLSKTRSYLDGVILPFWKNVRLVDVTPARVEKFQASVLLRTRIQRNRETGELEERPIRVKTARNIVAGHFRALIISCRRIYRLPKDDPFDGLRWPRESRPEPDPFVSPDRTAILECFGTHKPFWFAWLNTLMWTGMRQARRQLFGCETSIRKPVRFESTRAGAKAKRTSRRLSAAIAPSGCCPRRSRCSELIIEAVSFWTRTPTFS